MGCDIHMNVEIKDEKGRWQSAPKRNYTAGTDSPFYWRDYFLFSFFVRNVRDRDDQESGAKKCLSEEMRGIPEDSIFNMSWIDYGYGHTPSYLMLNELIYFDYEQVIYKNRKETYKYMLGNSYFEDLKTLSSLGIHENIRLVFWFDN